MPQNDAQEFQDVTSGLYLYNFHQLYRSKFNRSIHPTVIVVTNQLIKHQPWFPPPFSLSFLWFNPPSFSRGPPFFPSQHQAVPGSPCPAAAPEVHLRLRGLSFGGRPTAAERWDAARAGTTGEAGLAEDFFDGFGGGLAPNHPKFENLYS